MKFKPTNSPVSERLRKDFAWVDRVAWLMDNKFRFGKGRFRFGLDPIINLVPFLGDIIGFGVSLLLVIVIWRNGASRKVVMLMVINVIIDSVFGAIPLVGNVFDFFYKANTKNIALLRAHYYEGKYQGKGNDILAVILGLFLLLTFGFLYLMWKAFSFIIGLF